jgi:hypothetical protein
MVQANLHLLVPSGAPRTISRLVKGAGTSRGASRYIIRIGL